MVKTGSYLLPQTPEKHRLQRLERIWWVSLAIVFVVGMVSLVKGYFLEGMVSTNLTNVVPWGEWVAFYIYFIGMSAGSFLLSTLIYGFGMHQYERIGRSALLSAIVSMITAITFIFLDIGRPDHVFNSIFYWNVTSTMAWEIHFYILYILLLVTELYFSMRPDLVKLSQSDKASARWYRWITFGYVDLSALAEKRDRTVLQVLGMLGIPLAVFGVHGGTGSIFAVLKARPFQNTGVFPIIFILSALVSGTALSIAIYVIKNRVFQRPDDVPMVRSLGSLLILFLFVELGLEWYEILIGWYSLKTDEMATLHLLMTGPYWWTFWGFQLGLAMFIPLALLSLPTRKSVRWILVASIATILGVVGVRFNMVVPMQIIPVMPGLPEGQYFPTLSEWITSFGLIAMCLILYTLGEKLLPIDQYNDDIDGGVKHV
ncbi:NrfD/PsrC family molybdoenzyme membrane anchor subunit [Alicyclobacillus sp. ALC3]|uniref:NrfD/PsrC family molybdoenzyme membrane anchor subunit n=1 Tax=Alicyclobacillus sp. ALC3 TaxID=2796143 RepID=UPI002378ADC2|nr:NrfD/PsrC family molybdoenzyme membrane anchor subunit [Alicyclobacillus sp. ALC3]WDL96540.1 polysulfide reductase NrfD [Alicyclobacillus sp. ALC3]